MIALLRIFFGTSSDSSIRKRRDEARGLRAERHIAIEQVGELSDAEWAFLEEEVDLLNRRARLLGVALVVAGLGVAAWMFASDGVTIAAWYLFFPSGLAASGINLIVRDTDNPHAATRWFTTIAWSLLLFVPLRFTGMPFRSFLDEALPGEIAPWLTPWLAADIAIHLLTAWLCFAAARWLSRPKMLLHFDSTEKYVQNRERDRRLHVDRREDARTRIAKRRSEDAGVS